HIIRSKETITPRLKYSICKFRLDRLSQKVTFIISKAPKYKPQNQQGGKKEIADMNMAQKLSDILLHFNKKFYEALPGGLFIEVMSLWQPDNRLILIRHTHRVSIPRIQG